APGAGPRRRARGRRRMTAPPSPRGTAPPRSARGARPRPGGTARARRREAAALVMPSLLPILVLSVAPLVMGIALAFTDARLVRRPDYEFVGVDNFVRLLDNSYFWESFRIGMAWAVSVTLLQLVAAMGLALLLDAGLRFQGLTRVLALIPWAMPPVVVAIMWQMIYSPNAGPLNAALGALGLPDDVNWLADFSTALPAVVVVGVWVGMPQTTVTLLAGLQQIPSELHEAAAMDGAGAWRRFTGVTLPGLRPIVASITSLNFIWNFNSFSLVYVLTEGGPGGRTMLPMLFTYLEAFKNRNIGYAAAMGMVLVIVVVLLLALYLRSQFRDDREGKVG
ncbi:carbohydrate ABC transporter permease, partial [Nocardiopsis tropica]